MNGYKFKYREIYFNIMDIVKKDIYNKNGLKKENMAILLSELSISEFNNEEFKENLVRINYDSN